MGILVYILVNALKLLLLYGSKSTAPSLIGLSLVNIGIYFTIVFTAFFIIQACSNKRTLFLVSTICSLVKRSFLCTLICLVFSNFLDLSDILLNYFHLSDLILNISNSILNFFHYINFFHIFDFISDFFHEFYFVIQHIVVLCSSVYLLDGVGSSTILKSNYMPERAPDSTLRGADIRTRYFGLIGDRFKYTKWFEFASRSYKTSNSIADKQIMDMHGRTLDYLQWRIDVLCRRGGFSDDDQE